MKLKRKELKEKSLQEVLNHLLENDYNFEMIKEDSSVRIEVYSIMMIYFEDGIFDDCRKI